MDDQSVLGMNRQATAQSNPINSMVLDLAKQCQAKDEEIKRLLAAVNFVANTLEFYADPLIYKHRFINHVRGKKAEEAIKYLGDRLAKWQKPEGHEKAGHIRTYGPIY